MTTRKIKPSYTPMHRTRTGLHVRRARTGLHFIYWNEQKLCRFIPEREAITFQEHNNQRRVTEVIEIREFVDSLQRLVEAEKTT